MAKIAYEPTVLIDQLVCPKESFPKMICDQFLDPGMITDPIWWTSEECSYQEAVEWCLPSLTVICYKLGITDYSDLVQISDQQEDYSAFEQEYNRLNLENWTEFTDENLGGYDTKNGNETQYLNWKEVDGIMYVLERLPGVTSIYKKA